MHEDWGPDGAGNGLGTLYAYTKAAAKAKAQGIDLDAKLKAGMVPTRSLLRIHHMLRTVR